jgi:hypothetical protein
MPIKVERFSGESILCATVNEPFDPEREVPAMFAELIRLRLAIQGHVVYILDLGDTINTPDAFGKMVLALAEASRGIKAGREAGFAGPPTTIFVGSGPVADLISQSIEQEQYGGVRAQLCTSQAEALALARARLST